MDSGSVGSKHHDVLRDRVGHPPKLLLVPPELFFGYLPIVNISNQHIPSDNATLPVAHSEASHVEPAIHAVGPADAVLNVVRLPGFERAPPFIGHEIAIILVQNTRPIAYFLEGHPQILEDSLIDNLDLTRCARGADKPGNAVENVPKLTF